MTYAPVRTRICALKRVYTGGMKFLDRPFVLPAIVLGGALIIGLAFVGWGISNRGNQNTISSTGSASEMVKADMAKWQVDVRRTTQEGGIASAYSTIARDAGVVQNFFKNKNLASSTITSSVISTDQDYSYKSDPNAPTTYVVHETVTVQTSDVDAIDALSHDLSALNAQVSYGTLVQPAQPEYYVSDLPALRIALVGQAVADARARVEQIAKNGGSSVGALASASSGVVQVLAPNSTNVEDYGTYDTSTVQKQVMVTARATFYVK